MIKEINNVFLLQNNKISYVMKVLSDGTLSHVYYGKRVNFIEDDDIRVPMPNFLGMGEDLEKTTAYSVISAGFVEFSGQQTGDCRQPNIQLKTNKLNSKVDFKYVGYKMVKTNADTKAFPETRKGIGSETLEIELCDKEHQISIYLYYTIYEDYNCIVRKSKIVNNSNESIIVDEMCSANLDFRTEMNNVITLQGHLGREFDCVEHCLSRGLYTINSTTGHSSAISNPFIALTDSQFSRDNGNIYSAYFIYSGNFDITVEKTPYDKVRLTTGINSDTFSCKLSNNEQFSTPETVLFYSEGGLDQMSHNHHEFINNCIISPKIKSSHNLLTVNCWEGMMFDINKPKLIELIERAAEIDAELFVIDDGWFGNREDDTSSLGDWYVDKNKFPGDDFKQVANYIKEKGMKFGLWFEPEMINKNSELYKKHPDWVLGCASKNLRTGRNQLMLDLSNPEVVEYLHKVISKMISEYNIDYIKWDMNREMTEVNNLRISPEELGIVAFRYEQGLYKLLYGLTEKFPNLILEGCASGGNRFDLGILYYMPQIWLSDNTDAIRRIRSQYGASLAYPLASMDCAVTDTISYMGRYISLNTRMTVASFGNFGYTHDFRKVNNSEIKEMKEFNRLYKTARDTILNGKFYAQKFMPSDEHTIWSVVSQDQSEVYAAIFRVNFEMNRYVQYLKFKGLKPNSIYRDISNGQKYFGDYLMNIGLPIGTIGNSREFHKAFSFYLKEDCENNHSSNLIVTP